MLEFSWQSFGFAVVNFIILVALLWKFLHKPLLGVLESRRKSIEDAQKKAKEETDKAEQVRKEYESKLAGAAQEADDIRVKASKSAADAAEKLVEKATAGAESEIANLKRAYEREAREAQKSLQRDIVSTGVDVAGDILRKLVDSDLQSRLQDRLLAELDKVAESGDRSTDEELPVRVTSAVELAGADREKIVERIHRTVGKLAKIEFKTDADLIAGTRVEFSSSAVDASLSDVLVRVREMVSADTAAVKDDSK
jgi:F-type H+-transporting ATPase subunit b